MAGGSVAAARSTAGGEWLGWVAILALAAFLRLYGIGSEPLWLDEAYSWWDARQTLDDLWRLVPQCDPHPPLYAAVLKIWMAVAGESAAAMRALGALVGVATTAVVLLAGREVSARAGWIAGLLAAIAPFQIEFAHEARPYALVALGSSLVVFGTLRVLRTLREPVDGRPGWVALVAGLAIALWSNNTSVLLLAALGMMAVGLLGFDPKSRSLKPPIAIAAAVVAVRLAALPAELPDAGRGCRLRLLDPTDEPLAPLATSCDSWSGWARTRSSAHSRSCGRRGSWRCGAAGCTAKRCCSPAWWCCRWRSTSWSASPSSRSCSRAR